MKKKQWVELTAWLTLLIFSWSVFALKGRYENELSEIKSRGDVSLAIIESLAVEDKVQGYTLPDFAFLREDGDVCTMSKILSNNINIVVVSALEGCNICRINELERWGQFNKEFPGSVSLIVTHEAVSETSIPVKLVASGKSMSGLPLLFDYTGKLAEDLFIEPADTPLILFLSAQREILFCYKGHIATQQRSEQILALLKYVYKVSGDK